MKTGGSVTIWFFIGVSLAMNGLLIFGSGLYALALPPENRVVLYRLHADIWWGAILLVLGVFYCIKFWPLRKSSAKRPES